MTLLTPASASRGSGIRDGPGWQMGVCSMPKEIKLTSTEMVNTPGIFRMFKHRFETEPENKAMVAMLFANVYRIGYVTSRNVLSGKIPVTIDDVAETVTFTVA